MNVVFCIRESERPLPEISPPLSHAPPGVQPVASLPAHVNVALVLYDTLTGFAPIYAIALGA